MSSIYSQSIELLIVTCLLAIATGCKSNSDLSAPTPPPPTQDETSNDNTSSDDTSGDHSSPPTPITRTFAEEYVWNKSYTGNLTATEGECFQNVNLTVDSLGNFSGIFRGVGGTSWNWSKVVISSSGQVTGELFVDETDAFQLNNVTVDGSGSWHGCAKSKSGDQVCFDSLVFQQTGLTGCSQLISGSKICFDLLIN